jgi:ribosomal protein L15
LSDGAAWKFVLRGCLVSKSAKEKIEKVGGSIIIR